MTECPGCLANAVRLCFKRGLGIDLHAIGLESLAVIQRRKVLRTA